MWPASHHHLTEMEYRIMAELDDLKAAVAANTAAVTALATEQATFLTDVATKLGALGIDPTLLVPLTTEISAQVAKLQGLTAAQVAADPVKPAPAPAA